MAAPQWLASGAGKVFQTLGQCKGEERRRELVAQLGQSENAEDVFQQSAVTLWSMLLDAHKVKKFAAPEGQVLPVLSLCLSSRLEKVLGAGLPAVDLNEATAQKALEEARNSGNSSKVAEALLALAAARLCANGTLPEVSDLVRQALTLVPGDAMEASACNVLANVYILMGQGKDALRSVKQGLSAMRARGGKKILEVPLLHTLMSASFLRHDTDEALRACREVALLCKDVKDPAVLALAEGCTALAHLANDEQGPAEKVLETSLKSLNDADGKILLLGALQEVSFAIGKPVSAVKAAGDLLALERKRGTKEGIARALLLVSASDPGATEAPKMAEEAKQQFVSLGDKLGEALALIALGKVQLSQPTTVSTALQSAKEAMNAFGHPAGQGFASSLMCLAHLRQEDSKASERSAREALSLFQDANHRAGQALAELLVRKSQQLSQKPKECKIVIDDDRVAHVEISGVCTPKSLEAVLQALHHARCKEGVKAVVLLLQGSKGPVSPAGYPGTAGGLTAAPDSQALASGTFLLGLRTLGLPCVVACCGKIAGPAWGLVLAADYRIAAASSSFILPLWGPPECFGDLVGHTVAMQLCYTQGPVSALTMLEYGVIHQCQKGEDDTKRAAAEVARRIASTPSLACHQSTTMLSPAIEKYASLVARGGVRA
ncbi:unnamed protein product [Cladocopium goreaui]|uniref:L-ornithine N(5)-oxygenase n=1 Tax=Cladocopium goreaui TaxID=2562237 RepID=A0A9P1CPQ4_9DINO|nr:unnamed protein product [Cladocopium goreaui]